MTDLTIRSEKAVSVALPGITFRNKSDSWLMKVIGLLLYFPTKGRFMSNFWTTIGNTIYRPSVQSDWTVPWHEAVHVSQHRRDKYGHSIRYLMPQLFGPLAALVFAPFVGWWALLFLVFLLPFPSHGRYLKEKEGYLFQVALLELQRKGIITENTFVRDHILKAFTGPAYYFMWPFSVEMQKQNILLAAKSAVRPDIYDTPHGVHDRKLWKAAVAFMRENNLIDPKHGIPS